MEYDEWQLKVLNTPGNIALRSGRQSGKSTVVAELVRRYAVEEKDKLVLVVASVERQAKELFQKILHNMQDNNNDLICKGLKKPTQNKMELKNGTRILCLPTGLDGSGIRGFTVDLLIADEAAFIPRAVWTAITPMISTRVKYGARIILLSTPFGRDNYFYDRFDDDTFTKFHVSSEECGRVDKAFLANEKKTMSKMAYAQEYLGEFADDDMQFFNDDLIKSCMCLDKLDIVNKDANNYLGSDIARMGEDETTYEIIEEKDGILYQRENIVTSKTLLNETYKHILHLDSIWDFRKLFIDNEGIGVGVFDFLMDNDQTKFKTIGVNNSQLVKQGPEEVRRVIVKEELYVNLLSSMRQGFIKLLKDDEIYFSLRSIQYCYTTDGQGRSHMKIFGQKGAGGDHIAEGLVRANLALKYKESDFRVWSISI